MSSSHDHHYTETKPVSFTVPFILAAVTLLVIGLFLSLCNPSHDHAGHNDKAMHVRHGSDQEIQHGTQADPMHEDATKSDVNATEEDANAKHVSEPPAHSEQPAQGAEHH